MDLEQIRKDVTEYATQAVNLDKMEQYAEAADYYIKAATRLQTLIKNDENKYSKDVYIKKAKEYCERAKQLKAAVASKEKNKNSTGGKGDGKKDEDDQDAKLKDSLSGCLITEKPNVKWSDVAGLEKAKEALKEAVVLPIRFPQLFHGKRKPWKGILLYGPPGTGKSFLAKAAATETGGKFFSVSAANIVSKWMGESERLVKALFDLARKSKPAIIFMDEIDSVMSARGESDNDATRRLKTEFLVQMQGVGKDDDGILVLGATNIPWALDPAVRRRFQKKIYISLPEQEARKTMFKLNLGNTPNSLTDEEFEDLANRTEGYSGSDIANLTQDAVYEPLRKCEVAKFFKKIPSKKVQGDYNWIPCAPSDPGATNMSMHTLPEPQKLLTPDVCYEDYLKALQKIKATVGNSDLKKQEEFTQEFGQEG